MNYIAHIHLAFSNNTSMLGNFMGDFVKGSDLSYLPEHLQEGIQIHRKIDSFIDHHDISTELKAQFPNNIRRLSGVILDVFYDHLLCLHWQSFCNSPLEEVLEQFYDEMSASDIVLTQWYGTVRQNLLRHQWLSDYQHVDACLRAYKAIEKRLKGKHLFADEGFEFVVENMSNIEQRFVEFYPQAISYIRK